MKKQLPTKTIAWWCRACTAHGKIEWRTQHQAFAALPHHQAEAILWLIEKHHAAQSIKATLHAENPTRCKGSLKVDIEKDAASAIARLLKGLRLTGA